MKLKVTKGVHMNKTDMLKKLKGYIYSEFGNAKNYAEYKGVSTAFISAVLNGKKEPTESILSDVAMSKEVIYCQA